MQLLAVLPFARRQIPASGERVFIDIRTPPVSPIVFRCVIEPSEWEGGPVPSNGDTLAISNSLEVPIVYDTKLIPNYRRVVRATG